MHNLSASRRKRRFSAGRAWLADGVGLVAAPVIGEFSL
jgi:hypothetical protein